MVERGANDLYQAICAIPGIPAADKNKARDLYLQIITTGFRWQREGVVEALVKQHYDEEVSQRLDLSVPLASEEEFQKIISHLEKQMLDAAAGREYDRASQFKRRIEELKAERRSAAASLPQPPHPKPGQDEVSEEWGK